MASNKENKVTAGTQPDDGKASAAKKSKPKAKKLDPHEYVTVRNGFQGSLVYISPRTGERFYWDRFGDEQEIELQDLRSARSSSRKFFENNWFLIDDPEVIDYLGVEKYYKNSLSLDGFEELFSMSADEIVNAVTKLSDGQKRAVGYLAKQKIDEGTVDSISLINKLEKLLGIALIER